MKKIITISSFLFLFMFISSSVYAFELDAQNAISSYLEDIKELETLAYEYNKNTTKQNTLIFIRSGRYNSELWKMAAGTNDVEFEHFVKENNPDLFQLKMLGNLYTPLKEEIDFMHMIASISMFHFEYWNSIVLGGWGGDLAELIQNSKNTSSDRNLIYSDMKKDFLGNSSFNSPDMYADLDALNIYCMYKNSANYLSDIISRYYVGLSHQERVRMFVQNQFNVQRFTKESMKKEIINIMKTDGMMNLYYSLYGIDIESIQFDIACELFADYLYDNYPKKAIQDYTLNYNTTMYVGNTQEIKASTFPSDSFYYQLNLTSFSSNIEVLGNSLIAKKVGESRVKANINGIEKVITIAVKEKPIQKDTEISKQNIKIKIILNDRSVNKIKIGKGEKIKVYSNYDVVWKTNNKSLLEVSKSGELKGKLKGSCYLIAKVKNGGKKRIKVTVCKTPTKLKMKSKNVTLKRGKTKQLKVIFEKKEFSHLIKWSSENKKIVKIDKKGKIKAVRKGKTIISAKTYNKKAAGCIVTVK